MARYECSGKSRYFVKIADEVEKQAEEIAKIRVYGQWQAFERG